MRRFIPYLLFLVVLLVGAFVYRPGLGGPFMFDDGINIVNNQALHIKDLSITSIKEAALSIPNGIFRRPVSMLSFALNNYLEAGAISPFPDAYSFKLTNLIIHLLNGVAIFFLTRLLVSIFRERYQPEIPPDYPAWLALTVSAAWLLHPLNLTSVLYTVQRMTSLSALFTSLGLIAYLWGRARLADGRRGGMVAILFGLLLFAPLALLSKENGALLPFFMLVVEVTLFRFEAARPGARRVLIVFFLVCAALPAVALVAYVMQYPEWVQGGYLRRDFTLPERLMTEARIIWFYLRLIVLPDISLMGMHHDDFAVSRQLFEPLTTLPAILGIFGIVFCAWLLRKRQPLMALGILFFLVGHSMESTFISLELIHEHRNYFPMYGILFALFHLLLAPSHFPDAGLPRRALAVLLIPLFAFGTYSRASDWGNSFDLWQAEIRHHPASARAHVEMGDLYAFHASIRSDKADVQETYSQSAARHYERAVALDEKDVNGLFGLIRLFATQGRHVEEAWLKELAHRLEHNAIPPNTNDLLIMLARCRTQDICTLPVDGFESLMQAPLRNPKVSGRGKALIYSAQAYYYFNAGHNVHAAIEAAHQSIKLAPEELEYRQSLLEILIADQRVDEAYAELHKLRIMDKQGRRMKILNELERQLAENRLRQSGDK